MAGSMPPSCHTDCSLRVSGTQRDMCQEMLVAGGYDREVVGTAFFPRSDDYEFTKDWSVTESERTCIENCYISAI